MEKIFHVIKGRKKQEQQYIYISQNRLQRKENHDRKGGTLQIMKGSDQQKDVTIVNIYELNIRVHKYIKQKLTDLKGDIDSNTIILGNLTDDFHQ